MKKIVCAAVVIAAFAGLAYAAGETTTSPQQAMVSPALETIGLQLVPSTKTGGPQEYTITQTMINDLTTMMKSGKKFVLDSQGHLSKQ